MAKSAAVTGLYVNTEKKYGFFNIFVNPVSVGPRARDLSEFDRGLIDSLPPADEIRNFSYGYFETKNALYLDGLTVAAQGNDEPLGTDAKRELYGFEVVYRDIYKLDSATAKRMARTLDHVERVCERLNAKYGRPATFGAYVARIAEAVGATRIVVPTDPRSSSYDDRKHRILSIADGVFTIDRLVSDWVAAKEVSNVSV